MTIQRIPEQTFRFQLANRREFWQARADCRDIERAFGEKVGAAAFRQQLQIRADRARHAIDISVSGLSGLIALCFIGSLLELQFGVQQTLVPDKAGARHWP